MNELYDGCFHESLLPFPYEELDSGLTEAAVVVLGRSSDDGGKQA